MFPAVKTFVMQLVSRRKEALELEMMKFVLQQAA